MVLYKKGFTAFQQNSVTQHAKHAQSETIQTNVLDAVQVLVLLHMQHYQLGKVWAHVQ